jgi:drug/metabolite transporter superfamily protein YnfA
MKKRILLILSLLSFGIFATAQEASIAGKIYAKASNTVLPKSKLILKRENIYQKKTKTDHRGNYAFVQLPQGNYSLWILQDGFCQLEVFQITVTDSQSIHLDLGLVQDAISTTKMPATKISKIYQQPTYYNLLQKDSNAYESFSNQYHIINAVYFGPTIRIAPAIPAHPPLPREKATHFNDSFKALEKKPGMF